MAKKPCTVRTPNRTYQFIDGKWKSRITVFVGEMKSGEKIELSGTIEVIRKGKQ